MLFTYVGEIYFDGLSKNISLIFILSLPLRRDGRKSGLPRKTLCQAEMHFSLVHWALLDPTAVRSRGPKAHICFNNQYQVVQRIAENNFKQKNSSPLDSYPWINSRSCPNKIALAICLISPPVFLWLMCGTMLFGCAQLLQLKIMHFGYV